MLFLSSLDTFFTIRCIYFFFLKLLIILRCTKFTKFLLGVYVSKGAKGGTDFWISAYLFPYYQEVIYLCNNLPLSPIGDKQNIGKGGEIIWDAPCYSKCWFLIQIWREIVPFWAFLYTKHKLEGLGYNVWLAWVAKSDISDHDWLTLIKCNLVYKCLMGCFVFFLFSFFLFFFFLIFCNKIGPSLWRFDRKSVNFGQNLAKNWWYEWVSFSWKMWHVLTRTKFE